MDGTKCTGDECPLRATCYRFYVDANDLYQSYWLNVPYKDGECEYYWHRCKHTWKPGDSCARNNDCKYPDCTEEGVLKPIHKFNDGQGATLCHGCNSTLKEEHTEDLFCKECQEIRTTFINKHRV